MAAARRREMQKMNQMPLGNSNSNGSPQIGGNAYREGAQSIDSSYGSQQQTQPMTQSIPPQAQQSQTIPPQSMPSQSVPPQSVPPQSMPPQSSNQLSIFSPQQSTLLKAQLAAFKSLLKNQPVPQEIANFIFNEPLRNSPSLQNSPPLQNSPQPYSQSMQMSQSQSSNQGVSPKTLPEEIPTPAQPSLQLPVKPPLEQFEARPVKSPKAPPCEISLLKTSEKVTDVHDPLSHVDAFTIPPIPEPCSFEELFEHRKIIPGILPPALDIDSAKQIKEYEYNMQIASTLEGFSPNDLEAKALRLLPFQKAVRGHVLATVWHQNTLLTNTHPSFLAKVRKINMSDAFSTNALYEQQQRLALRAQQSRKLEELHQITATSRLFLDKQSLKQDKLIKTARAVALFHTHNEKEEQKRSEKNAKQRLLALKANDEEAYIKLLDQTKDTRITHLLRQTNSFLASLSQAVKDQQRDTKVRTLANGHIVEESKGVEEKLEQEENADYYSVAHRVKEEVNKQPSILVGGTLKEYQVKGLEWMVSLFNNHLNGILADEMGLGKTIQTIALLTYLVEVKKISGPFLVIVPLSTLTNWNMEFEKWAPSLRKITFKGSPNYRKSISHDIRAQNFQVLLTTFEYIIRDRPLLSKIRWVHTIMDEGHRMKNNQSKLSSTLTHYYHSDYRLILTGTPLQNNLPELWALLNFVLPKIFNSVKSFDEWFNTPFANTGGQDKMALSEEETLLVIRRLHKVLRPFLLRRLKKDVEKDLPDKVEKVIKCKMSALQSKLYQQMLKYHQLYVGEKGTKGSVKANNKLMQLRKICNHPYVFEQVEDLINPFQETKNDIWRVSGKFELLDRILPKFKITGHRVLIFFQMTQIMDIMEDFLRFREFKYLRLDGATKADDRQTMLREFNDENSEYFAFLLSTRAGGLGLNLQTADTVIIFDTDWNPHQDLQAQDRAHRIGQKNEVRILRLITDDSIEEMILERAMQKLEIDGKVIQAGKFDHKSTAEEQEALLRALLEAEDNKKNSKEEDEGMTDTELNEVLARSENEIKVFKQLDEVRQSEPFAKQRLMTEEELPEIYKQDPEVIFAKPEEIEYGRGARERKVRDYDENAEEGQWLKQFERSDGSDSDDIGPRKRAKRRDDFIVDDDEEKSKRRNNPRPKGRPLSGKSKTATRVGTPLSQQDPYSVALTLSDDERSQLQQNLWLMYDHVLDYVNGEGRRFSDVFLVKPHKRWYPDYYRLIRYPIALDTIKKRIEGMIYNSLNELMEDLHLMFVNAMTYNEVGSVIYNDASFLERYAMDEYEKMTQCRIDFSAFDEKYGLGKLMLPPQQVVTQPVASVYPPQMSIDPAFF